MLALLEVQAAHRAVAGLGLIVLNEVVVQACGFELGLAVAFEEVAARVFKNAGLDDVNAFYELRPEAELQKALAQKSQESLFDNFAGTHVDMLLAQYEEEEE